MAERPRSIPHSAIGRSTPIKGGEAYARVRRTVHSTVTSPFRAKISDQVRDNKRLLADGMITLEEYKSRKRDIVAMLREKRRRKQWEEDDTTAALETASVITAQTLGSGGPSLGSALPSAYTESIASSYDDNGGGGRQNKNAAGGNASSSKGTGRKKDKDSSSSSKTKKKQKLTKKKKKKRRRSLGRGTEPNTASRFNYNQPLDDSGSAHTNARGSRKRSANKNRHHFDDSRQSGRDHHRDVEPRRGSAFVLDDEKSFQSRDAVQWRRRRRRTKHDVDKENRRGDQRLDSVEKQQQRRDNVLDETVVHSSDKAMRGLSPRALQRMSQTSGSIDRDRPLFDMGRQFHGNMALELELLRAENRKLRRDLQTRTQQVISLERQLVQAQRQRTAADNSNSNSNSNSNNHSQRRQAAEQNHHRRAPGPGSPDTTSTPVGAEAAAAMDKSEAAHAGAQMDSPRATRRLLNSFKATIAKLKDDNDQLKVKLMRSTTKKDKKDDETKKKKKKKKKKQGRRDRVGAGLSADTSVLRMLLGIPSASLVTIDLTPGAALGCIMEEFTSNGISVIRVHQLLPTAQAGIRVGDIVASVNDKSTVGNDMDHFAQMINPQQHSKRQLKLLRPEGQDGTNGSSNDNDGATGSVASFSGPTGTASVASFNHHGTASVASSRESARAAQATAEEQNSEAPMLVDCPQCKTELRVPLGGERTGFRCGRCNSALSVASVKQQLEEHKLRSSLKSSLSSGGASGKSKKTVAFGRHVVHI